MTTTFELFTANYTRFDPRMGTPVRSSNGAPRWKLKYDLIHAVRETFPARAIMKAPKDVFRTEYRKGLDAHGLDVIASRFRAITVAHDEPRLVLLCFEKLETGSWCHRTMFAEWWLDRTGEYVAELGPAGPPPAAVPEPTLFG